MKFKGTLIVVKDCKKALKFYKDMFGFELIRDNDGNLDRFSRIGRMICAAFEGGWRNVR